MTSRERVERRLAAVLIADVAGYSRLMGEDEEGTHAADWLVPRPQQSEYRKPGVGCGGRSGGGIGTAGDRGCQ
jgi:hypothetical protein